MEDRASPTDPPTSPGAPMRGHGDREPQAQQGGLPPSPSVWTAMQVGGSEGAPAQAHETVLTPDRAGEGGGCGHQAPPPSSPSKDLSFSCSSSDPGSHDTHLLVQTVTHAPALAVARSPARTVCLSLVPTAAHAGPRRHHSGEGHGSPAFLLTRGHLGVHPYLFWAPPTPTPWLGSLPVICSHHRWRPLRAEGSCQGQAP